MSMFGDLVRCFLPTYAFCTPDCYCPVKRCCEDKHRPPPDDPGLNLSVNDVARMSFEDLKQAILSARYLPSVQNKTVCLVYLTMLSQSRDGFPFTHDQQNILDDSLLTNRITALCLNIGTILTPILACTGWMGMLGLNVACPLSVLVATPTSINTTASTANAVFSFIATGTNPDAARIKADDKQDMRLNVINEIYANLAFHLVSMRDDINQYGIAYRIAREMDLGQLEAHMNEVAHGTDFSLMIRHLDTARRYVLDEDLGDLPSALVKAYIGRGYRPAAAAPWTESETPPDMMEEN